MDWNRLKQFIELESARLIEYYGSYPDPEKHALARTVKLSEEVGELCEQVLARYSLQRKQKLESAGEEKLLDEFADVLITTMLLAEYMNADVEKALEKKMERINRRYGKK